MNTQQAAYRFDQIPLEPVEIGTNILVSGPSLGGLRDLLLSLLVGAADEGTLLVTADVGADEALADFGNAGGDTGSGRVRVIDCAHDPDDFSNKRVRDVASPADLTGIGMEFSSLYEGLYADGYQHVRTGIYTLAPLLLYVEDVRSVFRFLHTVTGRIRSADGLGVCAIDPSAQDERTVESVAQTFDGRIDLRVRDGTSEIRVRGLSGQPDGWHQLGLPAVDS